MECLAPSPGSRAASAERSSPRTNKHADTCARTRIHSYIFAHTHLLTHIFTHTHIHSHTHSFTHIHSYTYSLSQIQSRTHSLIHAFSLTHTQRYSYTHCIHTFTHIHLGRSIHIPHSLVSLVFSFLRKLFFPSLFLPLHPFSVISCLFSSPPFFAPPSCLSSLFFSFFVSPFFDLAFLLSP